MKYYNVITFSSFRRVLVAYAFIFMVVACPLGGCGRPETPAAMMNRACRHNDVDLARGAIAAGASVTVTNGAGWTPLHRAASCGSADVLKYLLDHNAPIDAQSTQGFTPIMEAIISGKTECAIVLMKAGASLKKQTQSGRTAIDFARVFGTPELVKDLSSRRSP